LEALKKLEHEYSLKKELDSAWAARPLAVTEHLEQTAIVLEDPGGKRLTGSLCKLFPWGALSKTPLSVRRRTPMTLIMISVGVAGWFDKAFS